MKKLKQNEILEWCYKSKPSSQSTRKTEAEAINRNYTRIKVGLHKD